MAGDGCDARAADVAGLAERLALLHGGDVHLHGRNGHRFYRIKQGDARVRVRTGVDDDAVHTVEIRLLDAVHERALVVGLVKRDQDLFFGAVGEDLLQQRVIGLCAVVRGLADAEKVEIRSVDDKQIHVENSFRMDLATVSGRPCTGMIASAVEQ